MIEGQGDLLPWQEKPFPKNPVLQEQVNVPGVFVHEADWLQGLALHSLISARKEIKWYTLSRSALFTKTIYEMLQLQLWTANVK